MLGYEVAKSVVELGREAFFSNDDPDLPLRRSSLLQNDDLQPQFGFVGTRYLAKRIFLIGINPGNGARNDRRIPEDEIMMPAIHSFNQEPTQQNFLRATQAYKRECQKWRVWKNHCSEVIGHGKLEFDDVAYSNCLPWRTASKSKFDNEIARRTAKLYLAPLIEELKPSLIVALGKQRVPDILHMTGLKLPNIIIWNRSQAATDMAKRERRDAASKIFEFTSTTFAQI